MHRRREREKRGEGRGGKKCLEVFLELRRQLRYQTLATNKAVHILLVAGNSSRCLPALSKKQRVYQEKRERKERPY